MMDTMEKGSESMLAIDWRMQPQGAGAVVD
jgi:hypothetical protein